MTHPSFGPIPRRVFFELVDAPFFKATKRIREIADPTWGYDDPALADVERHWFEVEAAMPYEGYDGADWAVYSVEAIDEDHAELLVRLKVWNNSEYFDMCDVMIDEIRRATCD